jgi:hypothetical protein
MTWYTANPVKKNFCKALILENMRQRMVRVLNGEPVEVEKYSYEK